MREAIRLKYSRHLEYVDHQSKYPIIWNGQDSEDSCEILKRDASLVGRQISCPRPDAGSGSGNPGTGLQGPPVTYRPGPDSPICTQNCGRLCSGFYCVPNPSGTAPGFEPPRSTPTNNGGGSNGGGNNGGGSNNGGTTNNGDGFPTLPSNPGTTAPPGQVCLSSSTVVECNGGPRGGVCVTSTRCASFGQKPTPTTTAAPNTNFISCSHRNQNPGQGIYTAYCVCDQSTFVESLNTLVTPYNSCAYTQKPTSTAAIQTGFAPTTNIDKCQVCTRVGPNQQDCTTLSNCTPKSTTPPKPTTPPSSPSTRCITAHSQFAGCWATGDGMSVQLWDDGVEVCDVQKNTPGANGEWVIDFDCGNGRSLTMEDSGRVMTYRAPDGSITLNASDSDKDLKAACVNSYKGWEYESVFDNGECTGKCPVLERCNFAEQCYHFDGKCY
jgi:hypothetical protein